MIGYVLAFETSNEMCSLTFYDNVPVDNNRIRKVLREFVDFDILDLDPLEISDMILVATDGKETQFFDIKPESVWPAKNEHKFYNDTDTKGGDKN